jgi:uncharacterized repeat protein (TIGR03803 family)
VRRGAEIGRAIQDFPWIGAHRLNRVLSLYREARTLVNWMHRIHQYTRCLDGHGTTSGGGTHGGGTVFKLSPNAARTDRVMITRAAGCHFNFGQPINFNLERTDGGPGHWKGWARKL